MIEKQKKEAGEALVSVVLFDDQTEVIYDRADIRQIQPMTDEQYFVRGCTALLDAIGGAISHIKDVRKRMPESERPEKTIFIITTDGMENASHRYNYAKIKKMIEKRQAKNWELITTNPLNLQLKLQSALPKWLCNVAKSLFKP